MVNRLASTAPGRCRWVWGAVQGALLAVAGAGCSLPVLPVRPTLYEVDVRLDPQTHILRGRTTMHLTRRQEELMPPGRSAIEVELHPALEVESVEVQGASLVSHTSKPAAAKDDQCLQPTVHRLVVEAPEQDIRITMEYAGELYQDVSAGEKEGQIHNFMMAAHVGSDGVYLDESGYWHPSLVVPEDVGPALSLADYRMTADPIEGFELVAGLERQPDPGDGRLHWATSLPVSRLVLMGGPLRRWTRQHGQVTLHAVLAPDKEAVAEDILDLMGELLDRYQPLLGPYPYTEFTVLEAFFSSGFAFPTCTQIAGNRLSVYKPYRRHGYIDHEMIHSWWGCGVYVDSRDGNWCEALTSYCANYYGYVLDGDDKGARRARRNQSNFLSAIKAEDDKPLGTYGLKEGAGRGIAYQKGAAVFHMLERKIGPEAFFAGLRRLTSQRLGRYTNWRHLREAFEAESDTDLGSFFEQWVRRGGAPSLTLTGADWSPGSDSLSVWISQGETDLTVDVPLRLYYGSRTAEATVTIDQREARVVVPCERTGLTAVELDPDYHVFRKLKPAEVMPTSALTRRGKKLTIVVPEGDLWDGYQTLVDYYTQQVAGTEDEPKEGGQVKKIAAEQVTADDLAMANVVIVGQAVRNPVVQALLDQTVSPVTWTESAFVIEDQLHAEPGRAVFFTVHHPNRPEGGVTVYYGNSEAALANASALAYYPNSLLVYETPTEHGEEGAHGRMHTEVIRRMDFESHDRIEF